MAFSRPGQHALRLECLNFIREKLNARLALKVP